MREWWKANGGPLALVVVGLALAGVTTRYGWVLVAIGLCWWVVHAVWKRSPWELRRKDEPKAEWIERLPFFLQQTNGRRWVVNHFIEHGHILLRQIPKTEPKPLVMALAEHDPLIKDHFRAVSYWDFGVSTFLDSRAQDCRSLYQNRSGHLPHTYTGLRKWVLERIKELEKIHARMSD